MSENLAPRSFDYGSPAVCRRAFTFDGQEYAAGDPFPYEKLGLERHRMHGMYLAALVEFSKAPPKKPPRASR